MLRSILSVLAGFALWTVVWLASNAALAAAMPGAFREDGSTDSVGMLLLILVLSVVFSVIAGYVTALLAREKTKQHALALGLALLAVGIFAQVQFWDVMPVWYHLSFLTLLIPGVLLGAQTQRGGNMQVSVA